MGLAWRLIELKIWKLIPTVPVQIKQILPPPFVKYVLTPQNDFAMPKKYLVIDMKWWEWDDPSVPFFRINTHVFLFEQMEKLDYPEAGS